MRLTSTTAWYTPALAAASPSAGGAATRDVVIATFFMAVPTSLLVMLMFRYRNGGAEWVGRASTWAGNQVRLPGWAAVPSGFVVVSLLMAVFGFYWDVAYHINNGRDDGPLANPSHYLIMFGLLGIFAAGVLAICLPKPGEKPSPQAVRIAGDWYAPVGGLMILASATFGLAGFPLDDFWHRLFGQDVTLWSPTHLLMLSGGVFTLFGQAILLAEGRDAMVAMKDPKAAGVRGYSRKWESREFHLRRIAACGGLLLGMCVYQAEFDYGVAQFQMIFAPMLTIMSAALVLVMARVWGGRGAALGAVLFYIPLRILFLLFAGPVTGTLESTFPIFIAEALLVEIAALIVPPRRTIAFAALAGGLIGTIGLAAEWGWSWIFAKFHWDLSMLPEAAILGLLMALCGAQVGGWIGRMLGRRGSFEGAARYVAPAAFAGILVLLAYGLYENPRSDLTATVTTTTAETSKPGKWVNATVELSDPSATKDAIWIKQIAWQGPGFATSTMREVAPGVLQTTAPLPASGKWKSGVRLHTQDGLLGVQIYAPRDDAIPMPEVTALPRAERTFVPDRELLQRESKVDGGALGLFAYLSVFLVGMALVAFQAWGIKRTGGGTDDRASGPAPGI